MLNGTSQSSSFKVNPSNSSSAISSSISCISGKWESVCVKGFVERKGLGSIFMGSEGCEAVGAGGALGCIGAACVGGVLSCLVFLATKFAPPLPLPLPTAGA